jgi:23S rRNA pseudouridine2604 synthase
MSETVRLVKRLAEQISCSRSEAESYIEGGWVQVDGQALEEPGYRVSPQQVVELMPQASLAPALPVTILFHKSSGPNEERDRTSDLQNIVPATRAADDRSGLRFLKRHLVGLTATEPLDVNASGLLVLTQDWRVVRKLVDDRSRIEQEYIVEVDGGLTADGLELLNHGLTFNGKPLAPIKVSWQNETRLRFAIKAPPRGLIAHMCEKLGLKVLSIKRIRIGRVPMAGLPSGQWRYLLGYERF